METQPEVQPAVAPVLTEAKIFEYREKLKLEQNLPLAFAGGLGAALVGAIIWVIITVATKYQIGYMAVGVGFLVGFTVRHFGKGVDKIFGIIGASLALAGCLCGNLFTMLVLAADSEGIGYLDMLFLADYSIVPSVMMETFSPMDILFYGLAIYEGYKFSFRQITEEEVLQNSAS